MQAITTAADVKWHAFLNMMDGKSACMDVQVATALARSAVNRNLAFPSAALNTMIYNPDPLETNGQGSQIGPQDPNFMHSFAWLDLTGETARQHLVDVYITHAAAMLQNLTHP